MLLLNVKLLKFAGFTQQKEGTGWIYPDGTFCYDVPVFTCSLDACFKWLWPKLKGRNKAIYFAFEGDGLCTCEIEISGFMEQPYGASESAKDSTPELAFCVALEKLIDTYF